MLRWRERVPLPQVALHDAHMPHSDTVQLMLQLCMPHSLVSNMGGQFLPPNSAGTTRWRERHCTPVPHEREHTDHAPKSDRMQSWGHCCIAHARDCCRVGQA
jgi:hypothetical protein